MRVEVLVSVLDLEAESTKEGPGPVYSAIIRGSVMLCYVVRLPLSSGVSCRVTFPIP